MTWVKLDDGFADHPKIAPLSNEAFRVFVHGLCYSARHLTDGRIPQAVAKAISPRRALDELVEAGLWNRNGTGFVIHDYLDFQPSSEQIRAKRAADSERKKSGYDKDSKRPRARATRTRTPTSEVKTTSDDERARDELWDALISVLKERPATASERGRWNKALKDLRDAGATADDIHVRAREYRKRYPDAALTPTALSSNWGSLAPKRSSVPPCPSCGVGGGHHASDCPIVAPFSDRDIQNVAVQIKEHQ